MLMDIGEIRTGMELKILTSNHMNDHPQTVVGKIITAIRGVITPTVAG